MILKNAECRASCEGSYAISGKAINLNRDYRRMGEIEMEIGKKSSKVPLSRKMKYAIGAVSIAVILLCSSALFMYYTRPNLQIVEGANGHTYSLVQADGWMEITVKNYGRSAGTGVLYADLVLRNELPDHVGREFICGGSTYVNLEGGEQRVYIVQLYVPAAYYDLGMLNNHTLFGDFNAYIVPL